MQQYIIVQRALLLAGQVLGLVDDGRQNDQGQRDYNAKNDVDLRAKGSGGGSSLHPPVAKRSGSCDGRRRRSDDSEQAAAEEGTRLLSNRGSSTE